LPCRQWSPRSTPGPIQHAVDLSSVTPSSLGHASPKLIVVRQEITGQRPAVMPESSLSQHRCSHLDASVTTELRTLDPAGHDSNPLCPCSTTTVECHSSPPPVCPVSAGATQLAVAHATTPQVFTRMAWWPRNDGMCASPLVARRAAMSFALNLDAT
jgi:hypothetical protein